MLLATFLIWVCWPPYRRQFAQYVRNANKTDLSVQLGNEGLNSVCVLATQLAVARGPSVMLVSAFSALHPVFTLTIGWILARSGSKFHTKELEGGRVSQKVVGIALIVGGSLIVALL